MQLQECLDNYRRVLEDKTASVKLKKGAVPHKFDCQPDRHQAFSNPVRPAVLKRQKREVFREIKAEVLSQHKNIDPPGAAGGAISRGHIHETLPKEDLQNINADEAATLTYMLTNPAHPSSLMAAESSPTQKDFAVQVSLVPKYRSKASSYVPKTKDAGCSPIKLKTPVKLQKKQEESNMTSSSSACNLDDTFVRD